MARPLSIPSLCLHRASGKAYVNLRGKVVYLGKYGSAESRKAYERVVAEWLQAGRPVAVPSIAPRAPTITELIAVFKRSGKIPDTKKHHYNTVLSVMDRLYGSTPAKNFDGLSLMAVRSKLVDRGLGRNTINALVGMIRRMFRWAISTSFVPPDVIIKLESVEGLKRRDGQGREGKKVKPVSDAMLEQIIEAAPPMLAAMIQVQRHTGMRAGELVIMRAADIDTTGDVWEYRPTHHKGSHADRDRVVMIGPKAAEILAPWLTTDLQAFIFSPTVAEQHRLDERAKSRKTPMNEGNRPGSNRKAEPKKKPGARYTTESYRRALWGACDAAFPLPKPLARRKGETVAAWRARTVQDKLREAVRAHRTSNRISTHQLRHSAGAEIRRAFGLDSVQAALGHRHAKTSEIYSELDMNKAREVAKRIG